MRPEMRTTPKTELSFGRKGAALSALLLASLLAWGAQNVQKQQAEVASAAQTDPELGAPQVQVIIPPTQLAQHIQELFGKLRLEMNHPWPKAEEPQALVTRLVLPSLNATNLAGLEFPFKTPVVPFDFPTLGNLHFALANFQAQASRIQWQGHTLTLHFSFTDAGLQVLATPLGGKSAVASDWEPLQLWSIPQASLELQLNLNFETEDEPNSQQTEDTIGVRFAWSGTDLQQTANDSSWCFKIQPPTGAQTVAWATENPNEGLCLALRKYLNRLSDTLEKKLPGELKKAELARFLQSTVKQSLSRLTPGPVDAAHLNARGEMVINVMLKK